MLPMQINDFPLFVTGGTANKFCLLSYNYFYSPQASLPKTSIDPSILEAI